MSISQVCAFVDDLVIDSQEGNAPLQHYQLKNSSNVVWGSGPKSIQDDFSKQYELNQSNSRESVLHLIISSQELVTKLNDSFPATIAAYSQVRYFPYEPNIVKIMAQQPNFQKAIEYLCAFENPDPDKIECVATVLLGAWTSTDKSRVSVKEILVKAQRYQPSFIRSFSLEWQLYPEVESILSKIPNFTYNLNKGFLHWEYGRGIEVGTLPYSADTEKFTKFQEFIKQDKPSSFDELERFLI